MADKATPPVNPLLIPTPATPAAPSGTQAAPLVVTPALSAVKNGMRQEGVIQSIRQASLERAKQAGRAANDIELARLAELHAPIQIPGASAALPSAEQVAQAPVSAPAASAVAVAPVEAPQAPAPAAQTFQNKTVEVTWKAIQESEKRIASERSKLAQEVEAFRADQAKGTQPAQELQTLQARLRAEPIAVLQQAGLTPQQIAQALLASQGQALGVAPQAALASPSAAQPASWQTPKAAAQVSAPPTAEVAELRKTVERLTQDLGATQNFLVQRVYQDELSKPETKLPKH